MLTLFKCDGDNFTYFCEDYLPKGVRETLDLFKQTITARNKYSLEYYLDSETRAKIYFNDEYVALRGMEMFFFCQLSDYAIDSKNFKLVDYILDL